MSYLVDTNVLLELRKGRRCNEGVQRWIEPVPTEDLYLSVLTLGEIRKCIENVQRRDPTWAARLEAWVAEVKETHADRLLDVTPVLADA